jgi:hypothetical protein
LLPCHGSFIIGGLGGISQVYYYRQGLCQIFANAQKTQILGNSKSLKRNDLQQIRLEQANHNINPKLFHVEQSAVSHQTPASPASSHAAVKIIR